MATRGHNHDGRLKNAKFCPWCGTGTLSRDKFDQNWDRKPPAFICSACSKGFTLTRSPRAEFAIEMFSKERAQRAPEERIQQQLKIRRSNCPPLSAQSIGRLQEIESLLAAKRGHTKISREHIESSLQAVRNEIARREQPSI